MNVSKPDGRHDFVNISVRCCIIYCFILIIRLITGPRHVFVPHTWHENVAIGLATTPQQSSPYASQRCLSLGFSLYALPKQLRSLLFRIVLHRPHMLGEPNRGSIMDMVRQEIKKLLK